MAKRGKRLNRSTGGTVAVLLFLILVACFMVTPMIFAIGNSLKPMDELFKFPPTLWPTNYTLDNFRNLFVLMSSSWVPMTRYLFNTLFITIAGTIGHILVVSMCAYPLSKYRFPLSGFINKIIELSLMFTAAVTGIPSYLIMSKLGWMDTYWALIIPTMGSAFGMYLMRQFMSQIPDSLLESARIDGANQWQIFWKIVMPQVKSAWLTLMIFQVQGLWNLGSTTYVFKEQLKTLPYALQQITAGGIARQGVASAVAVVMMLVPITIFIFCQSNIIETMATSGMKE
ncbi:MAG: carbohydrate ABC transporter permease [Eubacteriales bacterium]|nr:carbohydrate ABC transporter permease [Eubacteriales bacterium]